MVAFYNIFLICSLCIATSVNVLSIDPKIVGGFEASRNQFPYQVSLKLDDRHICGGTIINPRHVMTAGRCVASGKNELVSVKRLRIDVGTTSISGTGGIPHTVEKIDLPISFNPNPPIKSDMAILRIKGKFSFNEYVQPAILPQDRYISGSTCTISGWGRINIENTELPNNLRYGVVKIIDRLNCQWMGKFTIELDMLCAGYSTGLVDRCEGDSGGPLICGNNILTGVVSHGHECARPKYPGIYTDVRFHHYWISEVLKSSSTVIIAIAPLTLAVIIFNLSI